MTLCALTVPQFYYKFYYRTDDNVGRILIEVGTPPNIALDLLNQKIFEKIFEYF